MKSKLLFLLPVLVAVISACSTSERFASNDRSPQVSVEPAADCGGLGDACLTGGAGPCCNGFRCVGSVCVK